VAISSGYHGANGTYKANGPLKTPGLPGLAGPLSFTAPGPPIVFRKNQHEKLTRVNSLRGAERRVEGRTERGVGREHQARRIRLEAQVHQRIIDQREPDARVETQTAQYANVAMTLAARVAMTGGAYAARNT